MHRILVILLSSFISFTLFSQTSGDFTAEDSYSVKSVYYFSPSYPETTGWIRMLNDDGSDVSNQNNRTTAWSNNGNQKKPVAYVSGTTPIIGADIAFECNSGTDYSTWYMRGQNSIGLSLPPQQIEIFGNSLRYKKMPTVQKFPDNRVLGFEDFQITWQIANDPNVAESQWKTVGESTNNLYVTYQTPFLLTNSSCFQYDDRYHHTLLHIGCTGAIGQNNVSGIISAVWAQFTNADVKNVKGELLYYYKNYVCNNLCTALLLKNKDGQCGAWATFLLDILKTLGIAFGNDNYTIVETISDNYSFLVKDWEFIDNGKIPNTTNANGYKYVLIPQQRHINGVPFLDNFYGNGQYNFLYSDDAIDNTSTIAGQNNGNPSSIFENHQFVKIGDNTFLDPSYGVTHSENTFEIDVLAGHAFFGADLLDEPSFGVDINGDGDIIDLNVQSWVIYISDDLVNYNLIWKGQNY